MNRSSVRFRQAAPRAVTTRPPPLTGPGTRRTVWAVSNRRVLFSVIAVAAAGLVTTTLPATASSAKPVFKTVKLADSSGRSEPRVAVAPDGTRYVVTNAAGSGSETIYRSKDGVHWT